MTPINTGTAKIILVEVPDNSTRFVVRQSSGQAELWYDIKDTSYWICLPDNNHYTLLGSGLCPSISEEEWGKVLDRCPDSKDTLWKDYENSFGQSIKQWIYYWNDSARSLISSQGMEWEKTVVLIVNEIDTPTKPVVS